MYVFTENFINKYDIYLPKEIILKIKYYVIFQPKSKNNLEYAVYLWCNNKKLSYKIYGHISLWDTKLIKDMSNLFRFKTSFDSVISSWKVDNVTNMNRMFSNAYKFNKPINNWNVSNVTNMESMFADAVNFNKPLNSWKVNNVKNMNHMFMNAFTFNQDINNWDIKNVCKMDFIFFGTYSLSNKPSWYHFKIFQLEQKIDKHLI